MRSHIILFVVFLTLVLNVFGVPTPYNFTFLGTQSITKNNPIINDLQIKSNFYFVDNITVTLLNQIDDDIVVCIVENVPAPNFNRFKDPLACPISFIFKGNVPPTTGTSTGTSTTGPITTGTVTTGEVTTSTTGNTITTGTFNVQKDVKSFSKQSQAKYAKSGGRGFSVFKIKDNNVFSFSARASVYTVGVYFSDFTLAKTSTPILSFTGSYCDNGALNGANCSPFLPFPTTTNIPVGQSYFNFNVTSVSTITQVVQNLFVNVLTNDTVRLPKAVQMFARFKGVPSNANSDASGVGNFSVNSPSVGPWVLTVNVAAPLQFNGTADIKFCPNGTMGPTCADKLTTATSDQVYDSEKLDNNGYKYYSLNNATFTGLIVSVQLKGDDLTKLPTIFAGFNKVPVFIGGKWSGFDVDGCNVQFCSKIVSIFLNPSSSDTVRGTWFVAVQAHKDGSEYALWFNFVCPNNCSNQGTCQTGSDNYGTCQCSQNFIGLSCKTDNMLIEYIILIIIAALVLVSALLGLIAWAYMRKRAQYVEYK